MLSAEQISLENRIGHVFKNKKLLLQAMIHSSYVNEHKLQKQDCNERLEFLGDAILEQYTSRFLYEAYPTLMEGELSKMRAAIVSEKPLAAAARELGIGPCLLLGKGMKQDGGADSDAILSDAFEALLAAMYLDGGEAETRALIHEIVLNPLRTHSAGTDFKTRLQEKVQGKGMTVSYRLIAEAGPDHDKVFTYEVLIDGKPSGQGTGHSKKEAQSKAAQLAYEALS